MSFLDPYLLYFHPDDNVAGDATWTAQTGTEDPAYELINIADFSYANLAKPSKLNETAGAWQGDFGAAQRVDALVLWHSFDAAIACNVKMHTAASWGSPALTQAVTIPARRANGYTRKVFVDLRSNVSYSAGGFRYILIQASGASSLPIGLKAMIFSGVRSLERDLAWGMKITEHEFGIDMRTDAGHPWAYTLESSPRLLTASGLWTAADMEKIREWFGACGGAFRPTCFVPTPSNADAWIARWAQGPPNAAAPSIVVASLEGSEDKYDGHTAQLQLEEITAGDPEWY